MMSRRLAIVSPSFDRHGLGVIPFFLLVCLFLVPSHQWPSLRFWDIGQSNTLGRSFARIPRVLNFFPVPVEEECLTEDKHRRGICMNTYECRIQNGKSHGPCALGFGVCCIFTASCGGEVQNNLTYVTSPGFPNLIDQAMNCSVVVKKIEPLVSQLRIDFLHFNIGQPNRRTGVCDEDIMEIRSGNKTFQLCGWNSGQHIYLDIGNESMTIDFKLPGNLESRIWEMRITQLPFEQRAPAGCLQYFQGSNGTIRSFNYLPNGRFLAAQDYIICIRQDIGMCSISYRPCAVDSFRIGPTRYNMSALSSDAEGSGSGPDLGMVIMGRCRDKILIPCDFEEFITPGNDVTGVCDLEHCGSSLCSPMELSSDGNCRVETSAMPFNIRVAFGPGADTGTSLEENAGMCINYEQLQCVP